MAKTYWTGVRRPGIWVRLALIAATVLAVATVRAGEPGACHADLLQQKRDYYSAEYPDMLFVILGGGEDTVSEMASLDILLGPAPSSLDYEHPPAAREDLMAVSISRLWLMLAHQMPSAALFRADDPLDWPDTLCVLTFDPCAVARNDQIATQHLLDMTMEDSSRVPRGFQLNSEDYLEYVFDHEVYHCLKSRHIGPQAMSSKELWGEFTHFHEEKGADAYSLGMHIRKHGGLTPFPDNIKRVRGMALFSADPDHLTCDAIEELLKIPAADIAVRDSRAMFALATDIKRKLARNYDEYRRYLVSAMAAIEHLGAAELLTQEQRDKVRDLKPDRELVDTLVQQASRYAQELLGDETP